MWGLVGGIYILSSLAQSQPCGLQSGLGMLVRFHGCAHPCYSTRSRSLFLKSALWEQQKKKKITSHWRCSFCLVWNLVKCLSWSTMSHDCWVSTTKKTFQSHQTLSLAEGCGLEMRLGGTKHTQTHAKNMQTMCIASITLARVHDNSSVGYCVPVAIMHLMCFKFMTGCC